jgi:hypothetical protein
MSRSGCGQEDRMLWDELSQGVGHERVNKMVRYGIAASRLLELHC